MKILVACEFSGTVRRAFKKQGFHAVSCDLIPAEDGGEHRQVDVREILNEGWDAMIAFPPCTYLCSSGLHWNKRRPERAAETEKALDFVRTLMDAPIPRIAIENPIGCISSRIRKPDQVIHPWMFGHDESKATCLWLKGLPVLTPTVSLQRPAWVDCPDCGDLICNRHRMHVADCDCPSLDEWVAVGDDPYLIRYSNQTPSGQNKLGPSEDRWKLRSKTYEGIALAMADQWSEAILEKAEMAA